MFIEREIFAKLEQWKNFTNRLPLIIQGARQSNRQNVCYEGIWKKKL
jgi:hypothetical protein